MMEAKMQNSNSQARVRKCDHMLPVALANSRHSRRCRTCLDGDMCRARLMSYSQRPSSGCIPRDVVPVAVLRIDGISLRVRIGWCRRKWLARLSCSGWSHITGPRIVFSSILRRLLRAGEKDGNRKDRRCLRLRRPDGIDTGCGPPNRPSWGR
jgi:hypothetical protein